MGRISFWWSEASLRHVSLILTSHTGWFACGMFYIWRNDSFTLDMLMCVTWSILTTGLLQTGLLHSYLTHDWFTFDMSYGMMWPRLMTCHTCIMTCTHISELVMCQIWMKPHVTGWRRRIGSPIFIGHFPQKWPLFRGFFCGKWSAS